MKKEQLKRIKALLLAGVMFISLTACGSKEKKEQQEENENQTAIVMFIEGKAIIYSGDLQKYVGSEYSIIGGNSFRGTETTRFSSGTPSVEVKSREDAIELATAIVGEENIVFLEYEGKDMQVVYTKKSN